MKKVLARSLPLLWVSLPPLSLLDAVSTTSGTGCHPQHGCQDHPSQKNTTKPRQNRLQSRKAQAAKKHKKAEAKPAAAQESPGR